MTWDKLLHYWPFVRGIHRTSVGTILTTKKTSQLHSIVELRCFFVVSLKEPVEQAVTFSVIWNVAIISFLLGSPNVYLDCNIFNHMIFYHNSNGKCKISFIKIICQGTYWIKSCLGWMMNNLVHVILPIVLKHMHDKSTNWQFQFCTYSKLGAIVNQDS